MTRVPASLASCMYIARHEHCATTIEQQCNFPRFIGAWASRASMERHYRGQMPPQGASLADRCPCPPQTECRRHPLAVAPSAAASARRATRRQIGSATLLQGAMVEQSTGCPDRQSMQTARWEAKTYVVHRQGGGGVRSEPVWPGHASGHAQGTGSMISSSRSSGNRSSRSSGSSGRRRGGGSRQRSGS